jgi:hypothetical protein
LITGTGTPSPPPQPQPLDCMIGILELQGLLDSQGLHELQRERPRNSPKLPTPQHVQPVALHVMSATAIRMRSLFMAVISVKNQTDHDPSRRSTNSTTRLLMCKFNAMKFCDRPPFSPFHLYALQTLYACTVHDSFWAGYNESVASLVRPTCKSTGSRTAVAGKNCR